jgi:hypothetical protein
MGMVFKLIFTVYKGNKTLGVTQFFFPNSFPKRRTGPNKLSDLNRSLQSKRLLSFIALFFVFFFFCSFAQRGEQRAYGNVLNAIDCSSRRKITNGPRS